METSKSVWFQCKICSTFLQTKNKIWTHLCTKHSIMDPNTGLNKMQITEVGENWEVVTSIKPLSQIWVKVERMNIQEGREVNFPTSSSSAVGQPIKCHNCHKTFAKSKHLSNHKMRSKSKGCRNGKGKGTSNKKRRTKASLATFQCSVCQMNFKDRKSLFVHKFEQGHEPDHEAQSTYPCHFQGCGLKFRTPKTLELHKCRHDPRWEGMSTLERMKFKTDRVAGIGAKVYACPLCPAKVVFKWLLPKHLMKHAKDRPAKCDTCQTTYKTEYMLAQHLKGNKCERKLIEMETNRFHCDICNKFLKSEKYLRYHKSTFHGVVEEKKDYTCLFCGYMAVCPSHLEKHNRTHTGERPHVCGACGTSFAANHNLMKHMRQHCKVLKSSGIVVAPAQPRKKNAEPRKRRRVDGGDPLHLEKCPHCVKTFSQKKWLTAHIKSHGTNFFCKECGNGKEVGFTHLSALSRHYRLDHGKPGVGEKVKVNVGDPLHLEKCPSCPQTFSQRKFLSQHIRVHGDNFFCTECQEVGFLHLKALSTHYKIVHGKNKWGLRCRICSRMLRADERMRHHYLKIHGRGFKDMKELIQFATKKEPLVRGFEADHIDPNPADVDMAHTTTRVDGGLDEKDQSGKGNSDPVQDESFETDAVTPIVVKCEDEF